MTPHARKPRRLRRRAAARHARGPLWFEQLENRCVPSTIDSLMQGAIILPTDPRVTRSGQITEAGGQILYRLALDTDGLLTAYVHPSGFDTLLSLYDDQGQVLIQSDAISPTNSDGQIAQHLPAGTYYVGVSGRNGSGTYDVSTSFTATVPPYQSISEGTGSMEVTSADVNGDGHADIILSDYYESQLLVNLGAGDGTFQAAFAIPVGHGPMQVAAADFNGDGHIDLAVADQLSNDVTILLGQNNGTFQCVKKLATQAGPTGLVAGDFNGDGYVDLAVADLSAGTVEVFQGSGNGTFTESDIVSTGGSPSDLAVADFNQDGRPDLAIAESASGSVILAEGNGNSTFTWNQTLAIGPGCRSVIPADFNGDGRPDLAAVSPGAGTLSVLIASADRGFLPATQLVSGALPYDLVAGDFNGDGNLDIATCNYGSNNVTMFLGGGDGTFLAGSTTMTGSGPMALTSVDFNGDGRPDLATTNMVGLDISVLLNKGDATFNTSPPKPAVLNPITVITTDLNGDGILDLVAPNEGTNDISVLLGRGDGTFRAPIRTPVGVGPYDLALGDFNGDRIPDLAVANYVGGTVSILLGHGDGSFQLGATLSTGRGPLCIRAADLDGDGRLDLAVVNYLESGISLFTGVGDGTFTEPVLLPTGQNPSGLAIDDFNGDGRPDLAVSEYGLGDVGIWLRTDGGTFGTPLRFPAGTSPWSVKTADFNGDGRLDLVVANSVPAPASSLTVLFGNGNGSFPTSVTVPGGSAMYPLTVGDVNHDGHPDIVAGNEGSGDLSLFLGQGNSTFASEIRLASGAQPYGIAIGDFDGDGHADIVSADVRSNVLTMELGQGDGSFSKPRTIALSASELPTITADFNGDGLSDLAIADPNAGTITVRMGRGDGTFVDDATIDVGGRPSGLLAADLNGDGRLDIAVADARAGEILILLGLGDGTFQDAVHYRADRSPQSMVAADFNGDGRLDIAVADTASNDILVLYGAGGGRLQPGPQLAVGSEPVDLIAADLNGDGLTDLVTANRSSGDLTFWWNEGSDSFERTVWSYPPLAPSALAAADFNGDGYIDLAIADENRNRVLILWGLGIGTFSSPQSLSVGSAPDALAASDLDNAGDGSADLVVANAGSQNLSVFRGLKPGSCQHSYTIALAGRPVGLVADRLNVDNLPDLAVAIGSTGQVNVYLGGGDGVFSSPESTVPLPHAAPFIGPNGTVLTIDSNGQLLLRSSRPGVPGEFSPPVVLTADGTGNTASQVAPVATHQGLVFASLDQHRPLLIFARPLSNGVDLTYLPLPDGGIYTRLAVGDLDHDGRDDIAVLDHGSDQVLVFRQYADGQFVEQDAPLSVGAGPTDLALADVNQDGWLDLLVTNGSSGGLSFFSGTPGGGFGPEMRLATSLTPASTMQLPDGLAQASHGEPIGLTTGVFDPSGLTDVVVVLHGTNQVSILKGTPDGGLANPSFATTYQTGLDPTQAVAAPLGRDGLLDLAVLNEGSHDISIFMNDGHGRLVPGARVDAGNDPTGLAVRDVNGDGLADLLVGNDDGDLLILIGNGDGTFQQYQRADRSVTLAFGDLNGDGEPDVVLSNTSQDLLSVQSLQSSYSFLQGRDNGLLAPGPVSISDMNGDGVPDLVVANRGGNDVIVYLGLGGGQFAPAQEFYTGTAPQGLTVGDLDGNGTPDLVVTNSGSNDITILLGRQGPGGWTMTTGPRLRTGVRPVATTVADINGDGIADILCVNQDSDSVTLLRGLGGGFFDDRNAPTFATGEAPIEAFVGRFSDASGLGLVVLNSLSNDMTFYADISNSAAAPSTIPTGGVDPVAGVMGDFTHNGFDSLVIAHNGDARITLFDGTPVGLVLADSLALARSVHPTDLIVSANGGEGLQLYISAEGQGRVIPVSLSLSTPVTGPGSDAGGLAPPQVPALNSSMAVNSALFGLSALFTAETVLGLSVQSQAASTSTAPSVGSISAASAASLVLSIVSQAGQPLFNSSLRSLTWLVENLVRMGEVRTSDIQPLGENDMATVAVILAVSSTLERSSVDDDPSLSGDTEKTGLGEAMVNPAADRLVREEREWDAPPHSSALARFLAGPGGPFVGSTLDPGAPSSSEVGLECEWVWSESTSCARPAPEADGTRPNVENEGPSTQQSARIAPAESDDSALVRSNEAAIHFALPSVHHGVVTVASAVVLSAVVIWRRWRRRSARNTERLASHPFAPALARRAQRRAKNQGQRTLHVGC